MVQLNRTVTQHLERKTAVYEVLRSVRDDAQQAGREREQGVHGMIQVHLAKLRSGDEGKRGEKGVKEYKGFWREQRSPTQGE